MNNNHKITLAIAAALALGLAAYTNLSKSATIDKLLANHPTIDPKVAKKVYNSMMSDAFRGKLDCSNWSEERFNELFLVRVAKYNTSK